MIATKDYFRSRVLHIMALVMVLCMAFTARGANLIVRNFRMLPTDQTAINSATMKKDQNGKTAALIKIYTNLNPEQTFFDNGVMGVVDRVDKPGQIWLYIPARSLEMQITSQRYSPLDYAFEEEIMAGKTYSMELVAEGKEVTLSASVRQSAVYVDGDSLGLSPVNIYLSYGEHAVKAEKGSMLYEGNVMVTADGPVRFELPMEDENLKYSDVTVRVPDQADIYFQGRRVGVGEWKERLLGGHYSVEIRKANCEDNVVNFEALAGQPTLVECPALVPYRGFLNIAVVPNTGTRIMDGDTVVAEHSMARQLNIGDYTYTFEKKGYVPLTKTFTVKRNEQTADTVVLHRKQYIRSTAIYAGVGFSYGSTYGVGVHVGGLYQNFNLELGYTLGLGKSNDVYWFRNPTDGEYPGMFDDICNYSIDTFEAKAGYQFSFVERFGLTPQVGYMGQRLRGGSRGNGAMCHSLSIGARLVFNPHPRVGVFVNPEYAIPVSVNQLYKDINSDSGNANSYIGGNAGFSEGGFHIGVGVTFNF